MAAFDWWSDKELAVEAAICNGEGGVGRVSMLDADDTACIEGLGHIVVFGYGKVGTVTTGCALAKVVLLL